MNLKSLLGRLSPSLVLPLALSSLVLTSACDGPLSLLTGGGPNVAANVQAGKTNTQTLGSTSNISPTVSLRPNSRVESINQSSGSRNVEAESVGTINVNEVPAWVMLIIVLLAAGGAIGWVDNLVRLFRKKK